MNTEKSRSENDLITELLSTGMTAKQVINKGHARSTVYQVIKKMDLPPRAGKTDERSEIDELREKRTILKLKADIQDAETKKEKLLDRIKLLEKQADFLAIELRPIKAIAEYALNLAVATARLTEENAKKHLNQYGQEAADYFEKNYPES